MREVSTVPITGNNEREELATDTKTNSRDNRPLETKKVSCYLHSFVHPINLSRDSCDCNLLIARGDYCSVCSLTTVGNFHLV